MKIRIRQDAIVRSLRRTGTSTVEALAQETGVSYRTILRDISSLRDEGYLIYSDVGRGGGLQLDPRSLQISPKLLVEEVFALLICVATMRAVGGIPFPGLADAGLAKIERALPTDKTRDLRSLLECLHIGQLSPRQDLSTVSEMEPGLLATFESAFLNRHFIRFIYFDAQGRQTERKVEPQALLVLPPLWYMVAWDPMREEFRHFRMDRIKKPEALRNTKFRRRYVPFDEDVCPYEQLLKPSSNNIGA